MKKPRDYDQEYRDHQSSAEDIANRAKRNKDRAEKEKKLGRKLGPKEDVHHVGGDLNGPTEVISERENTAKPDKDIHGGKGSRELGSRRKKKVLGQLRGKQ